MQREGGSTCTLISLYVFTKRVIGEPFSECVLVIPMDARHFEPVASDVRKKVAEDFSVEEQHVHFWNVVTPVPLPSSCMLYFFSDIADILQ